MKKYVIPFGVVTTALMVTDRSTAEILPNTPDQTVWCGRISQIGAVYTLAGASGATFLIGELAGNRHAAETGWLALQSIAHTQAVVFGVKQIYNRARPFRNAAAIGFWKGGDSLPSGHSATATAVATVFAFEYWDHKVVPITAFGLAGLVAASRVGARVHWVSDVFVGGSAGFLIGRYVYRQHHDPELPGLSEKRRGAARLIPEFAFGPSGPSLSWRL